MKPLITICVCTYNRSKLLSDALESLSVQSADKLLFEVLIIDNNSSDNTEKAGREFIVKHKKLNIRYVFEKKQGLSRARNRGLKEAEGKYISFLDDDARADSDWVQKAIEIIKENPDIKIFGGRIIPYYEKRKPSWFPDKFETTEFGDKKRNLAGNESFSASNMFIDREFLNEIGGFDESVGMTGEFVSVGEETGIFEKIRKAGMNIKILYDPKLKVSHLVPESKMNIRYLLGRDFIGGEAYFERVKNDRKQLAVELVRHTGGFVIYSLIAPLRIFKSANIKANFAESYKIIFHCSGFIYAFFGKKYSAKRSQ